MPWYITINIICSFQYMFGNCEQNNCDFKKLKSIIATCNTNTVNNKWRLQSATINRNINNNIIRQAPITNNINIGSAAQPRYNYANSYAGNPYRVNYNRCNHNQQNSDANIVINVMSSHNRNKLKIHICIDSCNQTFVRLLQNHSKHARCVVAKDCAWDRYWIHGVSVVRRYTFCLAWRFQGSLNH